MICDSLKEACKDADVVSEAMSVTKENMEEFKLEWFKKGATVFSMGSFLYRHYEDFKTPSWWWITTECIRST